MGFKRVGVVQIRGSAQPFVLGIRTILQMNVEYSAERVDVGGRECDDEGIFFVFGGSESRDREKISTARGHIFETAVAIGSYCELVVEDERG